MAPLLLASLIQTSFAIGQLERVNQAELAIYNLKDDGGRTMDCLKVAEIARGRYLGIYHHLTDGSFKLHLAESTDLKTWKHKAQIEDHAHQGTMIKWGQGWLLAWEKDGSQGNWIRVATYRTLADLYAAKPAKVKDIPRLLSTYAEGTPSIFSAMDHGQDRSEIRLDFHYYRGGDVDRQAAGTLDDFDRWQAMPVAHTNEMLEKSYVGNIGDRDEVRTGREIFKLIECQKVKNDWGSWRIVADFGKFFHELAVETPKGSKSFANPSATKLSDGRTVVTMYIHSSGAGEGEAGCLLYTVRFGEGR